LQLLCEFPFTEGKFILGRGELILVHILPFTQFLLELGLCTARFKQFLATVKEFFSLNLFVLAQIGLAGLHVVEERQTFIKFLPHLLTFTFKFVALALQLAQFLV
jgi:hypothetical protein